MIGTQKGTIYWAYGQKPAMEFLVVDSAGKEICRCLWHKDTNANELATWYTL